MKTMKTIGILRLRDIFLLLVLLSLALSCGSDDNGMDCPDPTNANCDQVGDDPQDDDPQDDDPQDDDPQDDDPVVLEPTLSSVAPVTGPKHTEVVITGENFGTDATKVSVSFNGTPGEVLGVTDTEVTVKVPAMAYTGPITMEVDGFDLTGPEFVYELSEVNVETFAGGGRGYEEGSGTAAKFNLPWDLAKDSGGNIFVVDKGNNAIRKITPEGVVTTFTSKGGPGNEEEFYIPEGLAIDDDDNIYVADTGNHRIVMIDPNGVWSIIAGSSTGHGYVNGLGADARFRNPTEILLEEGAGGRALYVSDRNNHAIRRISLDDDQYLVGTYVGPGPEIDLREGYMDGGLSEARFRFPEGMAKSGEGTILLADYGNHRIRAIDQDAGTVGTFAGSDRGYVNDVPRSEARFRSPRDVSVAGDGNMYISDRLNHCIRRIDPDGHVTTIAGVPESEGHNDGPGDGAQFNSPVGVLSGGEGEIYVADTYNHVIRKIIID
ncbi:IPT/TIG domain-containing protein [Flagellimonas algicola]|nr:IPT/TIG domain-containing protein [Allomuricauda algicola]